jgi:hypothetical protein
MKGDEVHLVSEGSGLYMKISQYTRNFVSNFLNILNYK